MDERCAFGTFKAPYSGHSYENSEKGKISAESVNQREFHYVLYLSDSGRLYIGCQYLGNYGAYVPLSNALKRFIDKREATKSYSFRNNSYDLHAGIPVEVQLTINRKGKKITGASALARKGMITLQRQEKGDAFEESARERLIPILTGSLEGRREALAKHLNDTGLLEIADEDIANCSILVDINGREKRFYFFDTDSVATRYYMDVKLTNDGHPEPKQARAKMREILVREIIQVKEE